MAICVMSAFDPKRTLVCVQDSDPVPTSDVRCITRQNALFDVGRVNAALLGFAEC